MPLEFESNLPSGAWSHVATAVGGSILERDPASLLTDSVVDVFATTVSIRLLRTLLHLMSFKTTLLFYLSSLDSVLIFF